MLAPTFLLLTSLLSSVSFTSALPTNLFPPLGQTGLLCNIPVVNKILCPQPSPSGYDVLTIIGVAHGTSDSSGANRYAVKYGSANRWAPSSVAQTWQLPNGSTNSSALPLACPQPGVDPSQYSEDCLSMILYVPNGLTILSNVPVLMWIHGGSFIVGSATGPGIDGSKLAIATNSIVAVVQHRLGALGFMAPSGSTNLAVKDMVTALQFLRNVVTFFGGDRNRITIAGQSSGANMVRALLAAPTASSLFSSGILQSDPMDYGFLAPSVQQEFQAYFNSLVNCNPSDTACQNSLSIDSIIGAQMNLFGDAINIDPSATQAEPIRPVRDGTFITTSLTSSTNFPAQNKPLLISSVANEAGGAIYSAFTSALPQAAFSQVVSGSFGSPRSNAILASSYYQGSGDDARPQLEKLGTDSVWRCAKWTFARSWVQSGGSAYVGLYTVGATYPGNEAVPFCTQPGSVCHQDDIEIVFGTTQNPSTAQSALTTEMQQRYKQFLSSGNPNSQGLPNWAPATSSNVHPQLLGSSGEAPVGACDPSFWGQAVQYDYQVYNI